MSVEWDQSGVWKIFSDRGTQIGSAEVGDRDWILSDVQGHTCCLEVEPVLQLRGEKGRTPWPRLSKFESQAAKIVQEATAAGFMSQLQLFLPHLASLIKLAWESDVPSQARAALLFAAVARTQADVPALRPARFALERLAYQTVAKVYETSDPSSQEDTLAACYRATFRGWQAAIASPELRWLFGLEPADEGHGGPDATPRRPDARREQAMLDLLTYENASRRRLWRFLREKTEGQETVCMLVERWYLPRYDLAEAEQLKTALISLRSRSSDQTADAGYLDAPTWRRWFGLRAIPWIFGLAAVWYVLLALLWGQGAIAGAPWTSLVWLDLAALYLVVGLLALIWLTGGRPDTSSPRLLAGILVGVLGTVLQQDWGRLACLASEQPIAVVALAAAFVLASYKVLLQKIYSATGLWLEVKPTDSAQQPWSRWWHNEANQRCRTVLLRGLMIAFLLSVALTDLLGNAYVEGTPATSCTPLALPGLIGSTYPGLVLLFTPLLLFAGVFTQLIWQDQPITEALA